MAKPLISHELWEVIEPLLPASKPRRFRHPGRKPVDNRKALTGIHQAFLTLGCALGKVSLSLDQHLG